MKTRCINIFLIFIVVPYFSTRVGKWISDHYSSRYVEYNASYFQGIIKISGNYDIFHGVVFNGIRIGDSRPGTRDPNVLLVDKGERILIREVKPFDLLKWGAERNLSGDIVSYSLYSDNKIRPYWIFCHYKEGRVVLFDFGITNNAISCPFGISINSSPEFRFPISQKELENILGKPESITQSETLTLP
jgi:hypothetical protein